MSTFPYAANDPGLRTCARCGSRVYHTAMCEKHGVCYTCESKAGEVCGEPIRPFKGPRIIALSYEDENPAAGLYDYDEAEKREAQR
jgi:hypothetical protein